MTLLAHRQLPPSQTDIELARSSAERLSRYSEAKRPLKLQVMDDERQEPVELPAGAVELLMEILESMAAGRGITLMPENAELTTVQAAGLLNVSRPFLVKLLEEGAIPHRKVGKHRRIRTEDVVAYKNRVDQEREAVLDELTRKAQDEGDGY